jgi:hypothetical protein
MQGGGKKDKAAGGKAAAADSSSSSKSTAAAAPAAAGAAAAAAAGAAPPPAAAAGGKQDNKEKKKEKKADAGVGCCMHRMSGLLCQPDICQLLQVCRDCSLVPLSESNLRRLLCALTCCCYNAATTLCCTLHCAGVVYSCNAVMPRPLALHRTDVVTQYCSAAAPAKPNKEAEVARI